MLPFPVYIIATRVLAAKPSKLLLWVISRRRYPVRLLTRAFCYYMHRLQKSRLEHGGVIDQMGIVKPSYRLARSQTGCVTQQSAAMCDTTVSSEFRGGSLASTRACLEETIHPSLIHFCKHVTPFGQHLIRGMPRFPWRIIHGAPCPTTRSIASNSTWR